MAKTAAGKKKSADAEAGDEAEDEERAGAAPTR